MKLELKAFCMGWIGLGGAVATATLWSPAALASEAKLHLRKESSPRDAIRGVHSVYIQGAIPDPVHLLTVQKLFVRGNGLEGAIADAMLWCLPDVKLLRLDSNRLEGTLPDAGDLPYVEVFLLYDNSLEGAIPDAMHCPNLRSFVLDSNRLAGRLPEAPSRWLRLQAFETGHNRIEGTIPDCLRTGLTARLILDNNRLHGSLELQLNALVCLDFASNAFSGRLPAGIMYLSSLSSMILPANQLTGSIPESVGHLRHLSAILLSGNPVTGTIPGTLRIAAGIKVLLLDDSSLEGTVPDTLVKLENLRHVQLFCRHAKRGKGRLRGTLPALRLDPPRGAEDINKVLLLAHGQMLEGRLPDFRNTFDVLTLHENQLEGMLAALKFRDKARVTLYRNLLSCGIPSLTCINGHLGLSLLGIGNKFFSPEGPLPGWIMPFERSSLLWTSPTEGKMFVLKTFGGTAIVISSLAYLSKTRDTEEIWRFVASTRRPELLRVCHHCCMHSFLQFLLGCTLVLPMLISRTPSCPASLERFSALLAAGEGVPVAIFICWWCWCRFASLPCWISPVKQDRRSHEKSVKATLLAGLYSCLMLPLALPGSLQLVATCVPQFLISDALWSNILNTCAGAAQGLICAMVLPVMAAHLRKIPGLRNFSWAWESTWNLFFACLLPCCIVFFMDGACLAHWTFWWRPCRYPANSFRVSVEKRTFLVVSPPHHALFKVFVPEMQVMSEADICLSTTMFVQKCVRSLLEKVHPLEIGKLTSLAFFVPASKFTGGTKLPKVSTEVMVQLAVLVETGVIFAPTLPLIPLLLSVAAANLYIVALLPEPRHFQVADDAGIVGASIRLAIGISIVLHACFLFD